MNEQPKVELLNSSRISQSDNFINFKLIIIGDSGVGKSSLLKRAVQNAFESNYQATIGFEFLLMHFKVNDLKIKLQIWDTCGEEMYRSLVQGFYRNTSLAIIVYDISRKKSFEALEIWLKDLRQHTEADIPVFIVGNKMDLDRDVSAEEAKIFSVSNRTKFFTECSAKTGENVKEIFFKAAQYLYDTYKVFQVQNKVPMSNRLKLDNKAIPEQISFAMDG
jgi:small GTP-binding protein